MRKGVEKLPVFGSYNNGHGRTSTYAPSVDSVCLTSPTGSKIGYPLRLPGVRQRPASSLKLLVGAVPNIGAHPHIPTVPRERKQNLHLSNSDSKAIEALRPPSRSRHIRRNTTDDTILQKGRSLASPGFTPRRPHTQAAARQTLQPIANRPPSSLPQHPRELVSKTLPPISSETTSSEESSIGVKADRGQMEGSSCSEDSTSSLESDEEIISEVASDAPPSRPGFESDAEKSAQTFPIPFPEVPTTSAPFPATVIQDHAQLDMERFAAGAHATGLSPRTDNVVRAFQIHGPLDRDLLSKALNEVSSLHPLLTATFQRSKDKLYVKTSEAAAPVNLESPIVGHESSQDLIINARRKIFPLSLRTDICNDHQGSEEDDRARLSFVSVATCASSQFPESPKPSPLNFRKKSVTFAQSQALDDQESPTQLLPELTSPGKSEPPPGLLMRARVVCKSPQEHILVLSFPRIVCDFWSSCLFMQQLADVYGKLEKSASYRPSLAAVRIESKRQAVARTHWRERGQLQSRDAPNRLLPKRGPMRQSGSKFHFVPTFPPQVHFHQVAQREHQLLKMLSKERLWAFWESMVTVTIRRQRGPNRVKVIPPVRIPSGLGEKSFAARGRPQTSRLRPLTARNRPQTARRQQNSVFGELGTTREALAGPPTLFHFIKVEEAVCEAFQRTLPEECLANIESEETLSLLCLGAFALMLGRCCRGWGDEGGTGRERGDRGRTERGRGDGASHSKLLEESSKMLGPVLPGVQRVKRYIQDPLQSYKARDRLEPCTIVVPGSPQNAQAARKAAMGARLDLGSFLIGVEVSLRDCEPKKTMGLFGPLTNNVGLRVNLSSSETFADLVVALSHSLQSARQHGHFPFTTVAEELGLLNGLPIKFSFLRRRDIIQLTNPNIFYFSETAIGVQGHGLARFGSTCYLTPLSTKMDDTCYFELLLWEGYDGECVVGGFRYQPQVIRSELVGAFGSELCWLLSTVAEDPSRSLSELAAQIRPPFLSRTRARSKRV